MWKFPFAICGCGYDDVEFAMCHMLLVCMISIVLDKAAGWHLFDEQFQTYWIAVTPRHVQIHVHLAVHVSQNSLVTYAGLVSLCVFQSACLRICLGQSVSQSVLSVHPSVSWSCGWLVKLHVFILICLLGLWLPTLYIYVIANRTRGYCLSYTFLGCCKRQ